jgi:hypothetical protein
VQVFALKAYLADGMDFSGIQLRTENLPIKRNRLPGCHRLCIRSGLRARSFTTQQE